MSLQEIKWPMEIVDLPHEIDALIHEADQRIDQFYENRKHNPVRSFVPSDHVMVYSSLVHIVRNHLAPGNRFCEWGSGFGVATLLAASLGMDACGIEWEPDLVEASQQLADEFGLDARFGCGNYIPEGFDLCRDEVGESVQLVRSPGENPVYEELEIQPEDIDILFIYPWPGEAQMIGEIFDETASEGSLLVQYQGLDDLVLFRRVSEESGSSYDDEDGDEEDT